MISSNGGASWQKTIASGEEPDWLAYQGWYNHCIVGHPTDQDILYVGGVTLWKLELNLTSRTGTFLNQDQVHWDHHSLTV